MPKRANLHLQQMNTMCLKFALITKLLQVGTKKNRIRFFVSYLVGEILLCLTLHKVPSFNI